MPELEATDISHLVLNISDAVLDELTPAEAWWRDHQAWLAEKGYMLRPRYRPGWMPSWKAHPKKRRWDCEDWSAPANITILDAVRISDNNLVAIKQLRKHINPHELEIAQYLNSDELRSDAHNHTIPVLDVLAVPDDPSITLLVMPLMRPCADPKWETVGEVVAFVKQVFEGLQFMHEHHVAHRDCMESNIMYDPRPTYPNMYHPQMSDRSYDFKGKAKHFTRTTRPVKYYYIDFGMSIRYNPEDGPPREHPMVGGDKSVPEFKNWTGELLDPFPTDIYYIGNMVRNTVMRRYRGVEFLTPLVQEMVQDDPSRRPNIHDITRGFDVMLQGISRWTLRSRLIAVDEIPALTFFKNISHHIRTFFYILLRKSAIPLPP